MEAVVNEITAVTERRSPYLGRMKKSTGQCRASFGDMALDFDHLFNDAEDLARREALSLDRILRPAGVRSVLDCACGTGIQSIGLARLGYMVSASDLSTRLLKRMLDKAHASGIEIEAKLADFRNLRPWRDRRFDAAIACGNSLTLVSCVEDLARALSSMAQVVRSPGGLGVVGLHNYLELKEHGQSIFFRRFDGQKTNECVFDVRSFEDERVHITHMFVRPVNGRWRLKTYEKSYLYFSADQLRTAMVESGFHSVRVLDITGQKEFDGGEWMLGVGIT